MQRPEVLSPWGHEATATAGATGLSVTGAGVLVTQYCERTGAGFWAEPWNALTNLAFLAAALLGARALLRTQASVKEVWDLWLLLLLALATGIGSFLWHTLATP